jgi:hypothetical protein
VGKGLTERRGHVFLLCPLMLQVEHVFFEGGGGEGDVGGEERVDILKSIR